MIELYRNGFYNEPWDYYVGLNLVAGLRLRGQRFADPNPDASLAEARDLLPVVRWMTRRVPGGRSFWVAITDAELTLHAYLLGAPNGEQLSAIMQEYASALTGAPALDHQRSARTQLEVFRLAGDPAEVINDIISTFP
jgi:hypothetical protein